MNKLNGGRFANIECLRCVAMLFIVLNHCILNIATNHLMLDKNPINFCLVDFLYQVVYNGVNVFVLISGYFLVKTSRTTTNWEKVVKLWLIVFFYSVTIYIIIAWNYKSFNLTDFIHVLLPIKYDAYWFITQYLGLYIMSPFLAKWARCMPKSDYEIMLVSFFIITSILQLSGLKGGFCLVWFLFLFMFAGYLQLWGKESDIIHRMNSHAGTVFSCISLMLFLISFPVNGNKLNIVGYWGFYNGPLLFIASVSLFLFFLKMKEYRMIKVCSKLSPYMLGVYLIHEHPIGKVLLWDHLNKYLSEVNICDLLIIAFLIMFVSIVVEYLRLMTFKIFKIDKFLYKSVRFLSYPVIALLKHKSSMHKDSL